MAYTLLTDISMLVTVAAGSRGRKSGEEMRDIGVITDGAMLFNEKILWTGRTDEAQNYLENTSITAEIRSANGKTVMPGFVDSHTHIVFAGSRANEFARRLRGTTYQEIAAEGGGILRTMRATRAATEDELYETGRHIAIAAMQYGTTTIEIKSGYGLTVESELNLLRAANRLRKDLSQRVVVTFMGAHDFPPEFSQNRDEYVQIVCDEMLPAAAGLAEFCDVFTDTGYFTVEQSKKILKTAANLGFRLKVHADELSPFGAAEMAAALGSISADHLLFCSEAGMDAMKNAGTIATLLPGTAYSLRLPYAPARAMLDRGLSVAIATDCNPGSCYMENMQLALSLSCVNMRLTVEESVTAATLNGAAALGISDITGSLEMGKYADFLILDCAEYSELVYHFGGNRVSEVWIAGKRTV
ncbi:imidazolonepropionase [Ignavibacteria bacterium]|nr:imidazolonepropionase [Bacteroidota bacterium]MCZ2131941.1 imidazolonepropionase [Bacteroidota bacterium]